MINLWENKTYQSPIMYIIDANILEYDIAKANISVLRDIGAIDESLYNRLYAMPKLEREIFIGNYQRDHGLTDALKQGIQDARKSLFAFLGLNETNVIEINNDSITMIADSLQDYPSQVMVGPHTTFRVKGRYRSFYLLGRKKFYYQFDPVTGSEGMDIKGLGEYSIAMHRDYLISWLMHVFGIAVMSGSSAALAECNKFYQSYIDKKLPIEYYRRLDVDARFDINPKLSEWSTFRADYLSAGYAEDLVDGRYNLGVLNQLALIYLQDNLRRKK